MELMLVNSSASGESLISCRSDKTTSSAAECSKAKACLLAIKLQGFTPLPIFLYILLTLVALTLYFNLFFYLLNNEICRLPIFL